MECPFDCDKKDRKCSQYKERAYWDTGGGKQRCLIMDLPVPNRGFTGGRMGFYCTEIARFTNEDDALLASKAPYYKGLLEAIKLFGLTDTIKKELGKLD